MRMQKDTDNRIEDLGIYELRNLARKVGVQSPTSKKRDVLLTEIRDILQGKKDPYTKKDGRGRPSKDTMSYDDVVYSGAYGQNNYILAKEKPMFFHQNNISYDADETNEMSVEGIVDINMGNGMIRVSKYDYHCEDIYISNSLLQQYHLTAGDYVKGTAKIVDYDHPRKIIDISFINGVSVDRYQQQSSVVVKKKGDIFLCDKEQVEEGKRSFWLYDSKENLSDIGLELAQELCGKDKIVFYLCLNNLDCDSMYEDDHFHYIPVGFIKDDKSRVLASKLSFARADGMAKRGEKVVFVINSLSLLLKALTKLMQDHLDTRNLALQTVKEYLSYTKIYDNGGSFTLLCIDNNNQSQHIVDAMQYDIMPNMHFIKTK